MARLTATWSLSPLRTTACTYTTEAVLARKQELAAARSYAAGRTRTRPPPCEARLYPAVFEVTAEHGTGPTVRFHLPASRTLEHGTPVTLSLRAFYAGEDEENEDVSTLAEVRTDVVELRDSPRGSPIISCRVGAAPINAYIHVSKPAPPPQGERQRFRMRLLLVATLLAGEEVTSNVSEPFIWQVKASPDCSNLYDEDGVRIDDAAMLRFHVTPARATPKTRGKASPHVKAGKRRASPPTVSRMRERSPVGGDAWSESEEDVSVVRASKTSRTAPADATAGAAGVVMARASSPVNAVPVTAATLTGDGSAVASASIAWMSMLPYTYDSVSSGCSQLEARAAGGMGSGGVPTSSVLLHSYPAVLAHQPIQGHPCTSVYALVPANVRRPGTYHQMAPPAAGGLPSSFSLNVEDMLAPSAGLNMAAPAVPSYLSGWPPRQSRAGLMASGSASSYTCPIDAGISEATDVKTFISE